MLVRWVKIIMCARLYDGRFSYLLWNKLQEVFFMSKLEELLKQEGDIGFILGQNERREFLRWAKANGLKWINGKEIEKTDECFFHMVVSKDKTIANMSTLCWIKDRKHPACRMAFKDFLKNS